MEIKFHSMKERPLIDCDVIMVSLWGKVTDTNYKAFADVFNYSEDHDTSVDPDNYIGWIYAEELKTEMVRCAHEVQ